MEKGKLIEIFPKWKNPAPEKLRELRNLKFKPKKFGSKKTNPNGSQEEVQEFNDLYENLKQRLSVARINGPDKLMEAVWDETMNMARVTQRAGKLEKFGFSFNKELYLEYYEALFLLESGRLILKNNDGSIMSVEEAYLRILGEEDSDKYNNHLVFSQMTKCGYILRKHIILESENYLNNNNIVEECIFSILEEKLSGKPIPDKFKKFGHMSAIRESMERTVAEIKNQRTLKPTFDEPINLNFNRKIVASKIKRPSEKISEYLWNTKPRSLLDIFMEEPEYLKFENIFQKFNLIELNSYVDMPYRNGSFDISFDIYLPNDGFKKSTYKLPSFHAVVLKANHRFPSHRDMVHLSKQQNNVPILVLSVSDSKQIHGFLYFFST